MRKQSQSPLNALHKLKKFSVTGCRYSKSILCRLWLGIMSLIITMTVPLYRRNRRTCHFLYLILRINMKNYRAANGATIPVSTGGLSNLQYYDHAILLNIAVSTLVVQCCKLLSKPPLSSSLLRCISGIHTSMMMVHLS